MATLSIRLDAQIASKIDRIVGRTGKKKSEIVREAIADYVAEFEKKSKSERPYDQIADLIGSVDSGGMQLSTDGGRRVAEMLQRERDARQRADRRRPPRRAAR